MNKWDGNQLPYYNSCYNCRHVNTNRDLLLVFYCLWPQHLSSWQGKHISFQIQSILSLFRNIPQCVQLKLICKTNWYLLKKEDFMVKGHTSLRDKLQLKLPFHRNGGLRGPCAHCKLIDSGDVALYGVTCPQCGEIPPSRRHRYPQLSNGHVRFY